jgi:autotransporter-associated beta strand protein
MPASRSLKPLFLATCGLFLLSLPARGQVNGTWTSTTGGDWSTPGNWSGTTVATDAGGIADFSTLNITTNPVINLDGPRSIGTLRFADATTASHDWTLSSTGGSILTLATLSGTPTIQVTNRTTTISLQLAGNQGLDKTGAGTLVLSGANSFSGPISVSAGILQVNSDAALPTYTTAGGLTVANGARLTVLTGAAGWEATEIQTLLGNSTFAAGSSNTNVFNPANPFQFNPLASAPRGGQLGINTTAGNFTYSQAIGGGVGLVKLGTNTLTLGGTNTFTGNVQINAGTLSVSQDSNLGGQTSKTDGSIVFTGAATLLLTGNNTFVSNRDFFNQGGFQNAGHFGAITINVANNSEATLNGNSFLRSGGRLISGTEAVGVGAQAGILNLGGHIYFNNNQAGNSVQLENVTLNLTGKIEQGAGGSTQTTVLGNGAGQTTVVNIGTAGTQTGQLLNSAYNTVLGATAATAGSPSTSTVNIYSTHAQALTSNQLLVGNTAYNTGVVNHLYGGVTISGTGALIRLGSVANASGTYNLGNGAGSTAVLTAPQIVKGTGAGTLNLNGGTFTPNSATGTTIIAADVTTYVKAGGAIFNVTTGANTYIVAAALQHDPGLGVTPDGGLIKRGAGVLLLNGANTYTGETVVEAGTLGGSGSFASQLTLKNGATLAPGASVGTLTTSAVVAFESGSTFAFEFNSTGGTADQVIAGGVNFIGAATFSIADLGAGSLAAGTQFVVFDSATTIIGQFANLANGGQITSGANTFQANYSGGLDGNDLVLTVVPEPSQLLLALLGALGLIARRRRRSGSE